MPFTPTLLRTPSGGELVSGLPVALTSSTAPKKVIYSVTLPDPVLTGDILDVRGEVEATNSSTSANVGWWESIILAATAADTAGVKLTEVNGENVTPGMHHATRVKTALWQAVTDYPTLRFVNFVSYAASSWSTRPSSLVVERGYGGLQVCRWRNV